MAALPGWLRRGLLRRAVALACALTGALPGVLHAAKWQMVDWPMPDRVRQARLIAWHGQPAVLATSRARLPDKSLATAMHVLRLGPAEVTPLAQWTVPGDMRWTEPFRLAEGKQEWVALRGDGWYVAREEAGALTWRRACACPSIFGGKEDPDPVSSRFAYDLNGDGIDELIVPDPEYLTVYRWVPEAGVMEPWWRYRWEHILLRDPKHPTEYLLSPYWLLDSRQSGTRDLVLHHSDHLTVYRYSPTPIPRYALTGAARVRLDAVTLPPGLHNALVKLGDVNYAHVQQLVSALTLPADPKLKAEWLAALPPALLALQVEPKVMLAENMPLPGAPKLHAGDYTFPVALEDLTGNGYADLLQAAVRTDNSAVGQRGELRFYSGAAVEQRWTFPDKGLPITTDGAAVAELFRTGTHRDAPAALAVASTDVTLGAILRSLSSGRVKLSLELHVLKAGQFDPKPDQKARLTLEDISSVGRPLVLAADVDGDGWRELLINGKQNAMIVFPGSANGPRIANQSPDDLKSALPRKSQEAFVADLDSSGREGLVFWYRSGRYDPKLRQTLRFVRWKD